MNSINIVGRLVSDPALKKTATGTSVSQIRVAVDRPHTKDTTDFLNVIVWRQGAEYISTWGRKGETVAVSGYLSTRNFEDKNGNKRTAYEIVADTIQLCFSKQEESEPDTAFSLNENASEAVLGDEELPF